VADADHVASESNRHEKGAIVVLLKEARQQAQSFKPRSLSRRRSVRAMVGNLTTNLVKSNRKRRWGK
jgi:hypothetical protein